MVRPPRVRHSRPRGDCVLAIAPPYQANPWLGAGLPVLSALLEEHGMTARIVRLLDDPEDVPRAIFDASIEALWAAPSVDARRASMRALAATHDAWFERLLEPLLEGPERVFGLSVWRHCADVTLELARRIKLHRPDATVILGGPEAMDCPGELQEPWIDAIVGAPAESLAPLVVRAFLDERPLDAGAYEGVWLSPSLYARRARLVRREAPPPQPVPQIDYEPIVRLLVGQRSPSVPVVMNIGCPFRCGFCTNTTLYPSMQWGTTDRTFAEIDQIVRVWASLHEGGEIPALTVELCDATMNADPVQFDALCERIAAARWPFRPEIHGCFIVDGRITPERVALFARAGISRPFFGLETASPRLRRRLKKPGLIESVAKALEHFRDAGGRMSVNFNVIVGMPDETEAEFLETVRFLEWVSTLGVVTDVSVMPLSKTDAAMDRSLLDGVKGDARGVCWVGDGPGGDPAVRVRRLMHLFEHFAGILPISSVVPRDTLLRWMLPDVPAEFIERWCARHGSQSEYFGPGATVDASARDPARGGGAHGDHAGDDELRGLLPDVVDGWSVERVLRLGERSSVVVLARGAKSSTSGLERFALRLDPRDDAKPAYARTARWNLTYMREWQGAPCAVDRTLADRIATLVRESESRAGQGSLGRS